MYELSKGLKNSQGKQSYCWCYSVAKLCLTLSWPHGDLPGSSVHGTLQPRILEWVAMSSSRGSSQTRDWTHVSYNAGRFFTTEPLRKPKRVLWLTNHRTTTSILYLLSKKIKHFHTKTLKTIYSFLFVHWKTNLVRLGLPWWSSG